MIFSSIDLLYKALEDAGYLVVSHSVVGSHLSVKVVDRFSNEFIFTGFILNMEGKPLYFMEFPRPKPVIRTTVLPGYLIRIPADVAAELGIKEGDSLIIEKLPSYLIIKK